MKTTNEKKTNAWRTYRTRFLVRARQLSESLTFTDTLGREHHGEAGDYLMRSSDGMSRVVPNAIFEDIYVPMIAEEACEASVTGPTARFGLAKLWKTDVSAKHHRS